MGARRVVRLHNTQRTRHFWRLSPGYGSNGSYPRSPNTRRAASWVYRQC